MHNINKLQNRTPSQGEANIIFRGRIALMEIAIWIWSYLEAVSLNSDAELQQVIIAKLQSVPQKYGSMLKIFFGEGIADEYTVLLSDYIMLLINFINAQKNGDAKASDEYKKQLYQNVDQRADYLAKVNPFWQTESLKSLLYNYTNMLIDESTAFLSKDYKKSANIFDRLLSYSSIIGDYLVEGITDYLTYSARQPKSNLP